MHISTSFVSMHTVLQNFSHEVNLRIDYQTQEYFCNHVLVSIFYIYYVSSHGISYSQFLSFTNNDKFTLGTNKPVRIEIMISKVINPFPPSMSLDWHLLVSDIFKI